MKRSGRRIAILFVLAISVFSCIQEIEIGQFENERKLVVEASFTDELKNQEVKLFFTGEITGGQQQPLTGASVQVEDSDGQIISFEESQSGVYLSRDLVRGEQGKSYRLQFTTLSGESFVSDFQAMPDPVGIESINTQIIEIGPDAELELGQSEGLLFSANARGETAGDIFTRFEWRDALRTVVPYPSKFTGSTGFREIIERPSPLDTCYLEDESNRFLLSNSLGNEGPSINGFPLNAVRFSSLEFADRYVVEVKLTSLNRDASDYYEGLQKLTDGAGSLFDIQQGEVFGNVRREGEGGELILGYFEVASVRVEVESFDIAQLRLENGVQDGFDALCPQTDFISWSDGSLVDFYEASDVGGDVFEIDRRAPYRVYDYDTIPDPWGTALLRFAQCTDCIFFGDRQRPDFWED
jgi:hypothetical protein